jgi:uncharacterized protein (DUF983 family)
MSTSAKQIRDISKEAVSCQKCGTVFDKMINSDADGPSKLTKGAILVCHACMAANVVHDNSLKLMTREEFLALKPETKQRLLMTAQVVKDKRDDTGAFNPYV